MAASALASLLLLVLPFIFSDFANASRGDEQAKEGESLVSLQMLARGGLHSEVQEQGQSHMRQVRSHTAVASFLEVGNGLHLDSSVSNTSLSPSNPEHGVTVSFNIPYAKFATGQDGNNLHIQVSKGQPSPSPVLPAQPQQKNESNGHAAAWVGQDFKDLFKSISYSVIRIQTVTAEVNWFEPYQQPQDMQFTGSGWAVDLGEHPEGEDPDPIFLTNAHVVRDAHDVEVQLPAIGQKFFNAYVPLICDEFDLAVVKLVEPDKFLQALKETGTGQQKLRAFPARETPLDLGLEVASVGFPLGSTSLKLSRGVISGTEEVGDFICYQTTAPISPGSSGGPLFALKENDEMEVVGATFASAAAASSQNINYVVPTVAITQVLAKYKANRDEAKKTQEETDEDSPTAAQAPAPAISPEASDAAEKHPAQPASSPAGAEKDDGKSSGVSGHTQKAVNENPVGSSKITEAPHLSGEHGGREKNHPPRIRPKLMKDPNHKRLLGQMRVKEFPHKQFKIAPIDAVGIEGNKALFDSYGCSNGVFLSRILETSVFKRHATPEVVERSFLIEVNGIKLDEFGMGRAGGNVFLNNPIPFESLMMMHAKPGDKVEVKTCAMDGKIESHSVDMAWYEEDYGTGKVGIVNIVEPHWNQKAMDYEVFAGITVMQMTINHVIRLLRAGQPPTLGRWLLPENQLAKHLIITHVDKASYASRVLSAGMAVKSINGVQVGTLDEYRAAFQKINPKHSWTLETDRGVFFATNFVESLVKQIALAEHGLSFLFCDSVVQAAEKMFGGGGNRTGNVAPQDGSSLAELEESLAGGTSDSTGSLNFSTPMEPVSKLARVDALRTYAGALSAERQSSEDLDLQERWTKRVAHSGFRLLSADSGLGSLM